MPVWLVALAGVAVVASVLIGALLVRETAVSSTTVLLVGVIVAVAFLGEAMFGFGGGLLAVPLVSLLVDVREAVMLVLLFQVSMGLLLIRNWRGIAWRPVRLVSVGLLAGVILGTMSLVMVPDWILRLILAIFILLFLIREMFFKNISFAHWHPEVLGSGAGALGGWLHGVIGTGGPPFVMFLSELKIEKTAFRATLIVLLFFCNIVRVSAAWYADLFAESIVMMSLPAFPLFGVALVGGQWLHHLISEKAYRLSVYTLLFIAAVSLTLKGLLA